MIDALQLYESDEPAWHAVPPARCLQLLGSSADGLSAAEARDRLARHGPNSLPRRRGLPLGLLFVRQFRNPLIYLLLAATLISVSLGHLTDAGFIAVVLLLNAIVGTVQERRAATSMDTLDKLIRHNARVRRDDLVHEIEASEVVPGDVVEMESGMAVPADIRLLLSNGLLADESLLSGESLSVAKDAGARLTAAAGLADRISMLHQPISPLEDRRAGGNPLFTGIGEACPAIHAGIIRSSVTNKEIRIQN